MDCIRISSRRIKNKVWIIRGLLIAGIAALSSCGLPAVSVPVDEPKPVVQQETPAPSTRPTRSVKLPGIQFAIQVGAFSTAERAADYAAGLIQHGVDAYYFIDEDGLCKVRFERFDSWEAARQRAFRLQALGWIEDFFIVRPVALVRRTAPRLSLGQKIVRTAGRYLGTPYRWGGESADSGFDCSGLTMTVFRLNGLDLPRNSRDQFRAGSPVKRSALRQGDLVFFATGRARRVSHVGIYTGAGRFIHAPGRGKTIRTDSLSLGYFKHRFVGARRYF
jgi:hypothetical protein